MLLLPTLLLACGREDDVSSNTAGALGGAEPEIVASAASTSTPNLAPTPSYIEVYEGGKINGSTRTLDARGREKISFSYSVAAPLDDVVAFQVASLEAQGFKVDEMKLNGRAELTVWTSINDPTNRVHILTLERGTGPVYVEFAGPPLRE